MPDTQRKIQILMMAGAVAVGFVVLVAYDASAIIHLAGWPEMERRFFKLFTRLGESDWMLIPTLAIWALGKLGTFLPIAYSLKWVVRALGAMSGFIFLCVAVPGILAAVLKFSIGRARPMFMEDLGVLHFSPFAGDWRFAGFPSGHATTAFGLAWALHLLFGRGVGLWAFVGAALIAISRIVAGVHYPSDVVAGAILGSAGAIFIYRRFLQRGWIFRETATQRNNRLLAPLVRGIARHRPHANAS